MSSRVMFQAAEDIKAGAVVVLGDDGLLYVATPAALGALNEADAVRERAASVVPRIDPDRAKHVLLRSIVTEIERVAVPFTSKDVATDAPVYAEHHRAIGALAVLVGTLAAELGAPELYQRSLLAIGISVPA